MSKLYDPYVFWPIVIAVVLLLIIVILICILMFHTCFKSENDYSVTSPSTTFKNPLIGGSPTDSNPSYVNTQAFSRNNEKLPYFIRPDYLYSEQRYDRVTDYYHQTPKQHKRATQPATPVSTPSLSLISTDDGMV